MNQFSTTHFIQGIKKGLPLVIGYIPIAIAFGVLAGQAHLSISSAILMSILVYAGASQFMAVNMLVAGTAGVEIVIATLILNMRHLIMSLSLMNTLSHLSTRWKGLLSFGITDETFAMTSLEASGQPSKLSSSYVLGIFISAYASWVVGTGIGVSLYQLIPASISDSMAIALYAMFIGLLIPSIQKNSSIAIIAGASMILCTFFNTFLNSGWAIVLATILGSAIGIFVLKEEKEDE